MRTSGDVGRIAGGRRDRGAGSARGGVPVFASSVDWTKWAEHADPIDCAAGCGQFQPNHPRRKFCGGEQCPGRNRRKATSEATPETTEPPPHPRRRTTRRTRRRGGVPGVMAEVLLDAVTNPPDGTDAEIRAEIVGLAAARSSGLPDAERRHTLRLTTIAAVRAARLPGGPA